MKVYVVQQGYYEETENRLVTIDLDSAIKEYIKDPSSVIEIWLDEKLLHGYGIYTYENKSDYEKILLDITFIEEYGYKMYVDNR